MNTIKFNEKYSMTESILQGRKTMTRRLCKDVSTRKYIYANEVECISVYSDENIVEFILINGSIKVSETKYKVGEVLSVSITGIQIRITNIKVERLQDISDDDCMCEGVIHSYKNTMPYGITDVAAPIGVFFCYSNPREAFAALIDKIYGKGTWESNPYVYAYSFEFIK